MNCKSHKLLSNIVNKITQKVFLPALIFFSLPSSVVVAQITPDGTLESTVQQIQELMKINGGLREGNNLFHSFENFSIPEGMEAAFENATDIENIFTRVTGDSASEIFGTLSANGGANFFFMNPNGIVFGENASINVGGSFMATTADSIEFEDGTSFAANDTNADPVLTTDQPSGFTFDGQPGAIQVYGGGNEIKSDEVFSPIETGDVETGLSVGSDKTLALIGGEVSFSGGIINADGGRVEIGSVDAGSVSMGDKLTFNYENANSYQNISLAERTLLNVNNEGSISLTGNNLFLTDGSFILNQNQGDTNPGTIAINTNDTLSITEPSSDAEVSSSILSESLDTGQAASINVSTRKLLVEDGGQIRTRTYGEASSNDLTIKASDFIRLSDFSSIGSATFAEGNSGKVDVSTSDFKVTNGGSVASVSIGSGSGGEVTVNSDTLEVTGVTLEGGRRDRSNVSSSTFADGNAGNLKVNTARLQVRDGGTVGSSSFADGNAGSFIINSSESIEVSGTNNDFDSSIRTAVEPPVTEAARQGFGLPEVPSGSFGKVTINTPFLSVNSGGQVSARNRGTGDAGTLVINANDIDLDDTGSILATSAFGTGGSIELNTDSLQIDNESQVTATTENQGGGGNITINASNITAKKNSAISANAQGGDGGNITIDTATIAGSGNSDITANAVEGDGGNIDLSAKFIVGFEERAELTPLNDIVVSSEFGQSGTININAPETDAQKDPNVNALKPEDVEAGELLKAVCPNPDNRYGKKTFRYVGMGVPRNPDNYRDSGYEAGYLERRHRKETLRRRVRESLRNGGDGKIDPDTLPPDPLLLKTRIDYPPLDQPQTEQHRRDIEQIKNRSAHNPPSIVSGHSPPVVKQFPFTNTPLRVIYSQSNTVPPEPSPKPGESLPDANAVQINPDGSKHLVRVAQIQSAQEQMCASSY